MKTEINSRLVKIGDMLFVISEAQIVEKEGDNWLKPKTVYDPETPLYRQAGDPIVTNSALRAALVYDQIVAEHTRQINAAVEAWEASRK